MNSKNPPYQKYWLQINKAHKELKWMSYDPDIEYLDELKEAIKILEKIKKQISKKLNKPL